MKTTKNVFKNVNIALGSNHDSNYKRTTLWYNNSQLIVAKTGDTA